MNLAESSKLYQELAEHLRGLKAQGLLRERRILESPQGAHVRVDSKDYLAFCSNDYLGLANHPKLIKAASDGALQYGVGSGASHLLTGHIAVHHELEERLARFVGLPRALLFSTGYMANIGVVTALTSRQDAVFADRLNHASLNDAALLSRAKLQRYPHLDLDALKKLLANSRARRKLITTDAVFSMDGDIAPVPELAALCERFDAWLLLDDAHGFGVLGKQGRGTLSHFDIASPRTIYMATLGKAAGVFGAFVAGAPEIVETLIQRSRSYIYTTATPALLAHTLLASLELVRQEDRRRERLAQLIGHLKKNLHLISSWKLLPSVTPIQPLIIGGNDAAVMVSEGLRNRGILAPAIRPPTVPQGSARLRISLSAAHSVEDVQRLLDALHELERKA